VDIPRSFPIWTLWDLDFWDFWAILLTNIQTDRRNQTSYTRRPTLVMTSVYPSATHGNSTVYILGWRIMIPAWNYQIKSNTFISDSKVHINNIKVMVSNNNKSYQLKLKLRVNDKTSDSTINTCEPSLVEFANIVIEQYIKFRQSVWIRSAVGRNKTFPTVASDETSAVQNANNIVIAMYQTRRLYKWYNRLYSFTTTTTTSPATTTQHKEWCRMQL